MTIDSLKFTLLFISSVLENNQKIITLSSYLERGFENTKIPCMEERILLKHLIRESVKNHEKLNFSSIH
jgi:hypothetical protein